MPAECCVFRTRIRVQNRKRFCAKTQRPKRPGRSGDSSPPAPILPLVAVDGHNGQTYYTELVLCDRPLDALHTHVRTMASMTVYKYCSMTRRVPPSSFFRTPRHHHHRHRHRDARILYTRVRA